VRQIEPWRQSGYHAVDQHGGPDVLDHLAVNQGAIMPGCRQQVHHRDGDRDAEAGFAVNGWLDVPGSRHFGDFAPHPFQIRVGSQRADVEKLAIDRIRVAGRVGQREFDLFVPGLLRQLGDDAEVHIPDHVIRQNQKIRGMQVGVENAESESIPEEVGDDIAAEHAGVESDAHELVKRGLVVVFDEAEIGGNTVPFKEFDRQDARSGQLPEYFRDSLRSGIHGVAANQVAMAGLAAVVELVLCPGHLFANQVPQEVQVSYPEKEYQPDETLQQ